MNAAGSRIAGLDLARFLALAGMMCTHLWLYGAGGTEPALSAMLAGKASALFAVLAGVGIVLTTRRDVARGDLRRARFNLLGRGLALIVLGLLLGTFSFFILVILAYYGVMFLLLIPFVGRRSGVLLGFAAVWAIVWPLCSHGLRWLIDGDSLPGGAVGLFDVLAPHLLVTDLLLTGTYPAITWIVYGLVGMTIGTMLVARRTPSTAVTDARSGPATNPAPDAPPTSTSTPWASAGFGWFGAWLALAGAAVALIALFVDELLVRFVFLPRLVASSGSGDGVFGTTGGNGATSREALDALREAQYGTTPTDSLWNLLSTGPHTGTPFDLFITAGVAAATIGACLSLMSVLGRAGRIALMPVLGAGAAPLTVYTVHVVITTATWLVHQVVDGGAAWNAWWLSSWMLLAGHVVIALLIGAALRLADQRGPFERFVTATGQAAAKMGTRTSRSNSARASVPDRAHHDDEHSPSS